MKNEKFTPCAKLNGDYQLVWHDEFDGDTLNLDKWSTEVTKMGGRNILVVEDTPDTIKVKDGALIMTAYKDENGVYHVPNSVHTKGTMNYKFGYAEIRAKLPLEVGCFASYWTRGVSDNPSTALAPGNLDHYAEVDMFEVFQNGGKQCVGGNILKNFPGHPEKNWYATPMDWTQQVVLPDEEYHTYGYEWTPTEINYYYDGAIYAHFDITESWTNPGEYGKGIDGWTYINADKTETNMDCFREPQFLIFNNHLFYEGVSSAATSIAISNPGFKRADYLIDYCRVYQLPEGSEFYSK